MSPKSLLEQVDQLTAIGLALSTERNTDRLLEKILLTAKEMAGSDGGTLYSVSEENRVRIENMRTDSLGIAMGGTTGKAVPFPPIEFYDEAGEPNRSNVVTHAILNDCTVNIPDAYNTDRFDLSGTREFDRVTGYRSISFLTVPMKNHQGDIIGVLQLLNAKNEQGKIIPFNAETQRLVEALASQAAIAVTNRRLIDELKELLDALIHLIAYAIDEKSPYTAGHCRRVPKLTMLLADAATKASDGPLANFAMDHDDRYELEIAAWLHDCGKITTPEHVVDKATKLQTVFDRIELVKARFEVLRKEAENRWLHKRMEAMEAGREPDPAWATEYRQTLRELEEEQAFIEKANSGGEFMTETDQERVGAIGKRRWHDAQGKSRTLLTEDEIYNLTIPKGTLNPEEREQINNHIVATINILEALPFPKQFKRVAEYAGGHHERMDGQGYPRGLKGDEMPLQARIMAIADVFEALTARDRPYKPGKKLSEALGILQSMSERGHIDPDLFDLFTRERVWEQYAFEHLDPEQLDI
ncbi:GAF and HD-GYP domain-containing protein [Thiohalomonas denitrificans]|uniref:HD-GYP domain, c-di-GMP phosphodiesterase class II (Or its inactivated variant) n=1 Tax=Thiohalomonas denitrificans TaxID=415747 RepID=A0A1G5Q8W0_9GAMM|nr:HD family phosphohydrolase [Thiohalomonas denitrificans]SCZ58092.1 HD-GYP domain, c-di-GMP phosphodiesterase class II (or its inactivated variant) [Thiohalomonas denitrificans]